MHQSRCYGSRRARRVLAQLGERLRSTTSSRRAHTRRDSGQGWNGSACARRVPLRAGSGCRLQAQGVARAVERAARRRREPASCRRRIRTFEGRHARRGVTPSTRTSEARTRSPSWARSLCSIGQGSTRWRGEGRTDLLDMDTQQHRGSRCGSFASATASSPRQPGPPACPSRVAAITSARGSSAPAAEPHPDPGSRPGVSARHTGVRVARRRSVPRAGCK